MLFRRLLAATTIATALGLTGAGALHVGTASADDQAPTASECSVCHGGTDLTKTFPSGETLSLYIDDAAYAQSVHGGALSCQACHDGYSMFPHPELAAQDVNAYRASQKTSCKACHSEQYAQMEGGAHDTIQERGVTCTDCHGTHEIREPQAATLRSASLELCTGCHQDESLMATYGLSTRAVTSYLRDFHGRTSLLKAKQGEAWIEEAVCSDCHGAHSIARVESSNYEAVRANLTVTCQKCHEGATPNFPESWMSHYEPDPSRTPLVFLAQTFYWIMIPFTIGGLLMHIGIDLAHKVRRKKTAQS